MEMTQTPQNALFNEEKLAELHQIASGNKDFLKKIAETYVAQFEAKFPELKRVVETKDHEQIEQLAHLLKGASYSVGLDETASHFQQLELAGETNEVENLEPVLEDIERQMKRFAVEWDAYFNRLV
ncbi:Hpt domain-containing protein [Exiguobacterium sp. SH1S4]|nr:Hpt domain-containing protein [Exiguobacterium sp. SH4S7]TCI47618.1 Hpt domain-containing protein [Exiguobacterium sp. SH5S32]TCI54504.1 Hpt domain-containing protein [Exiguobacterium sp. SH1S4]TCI61353.1 Hpt domain-containing protein [Exiguobacterium sp. SH0S2]TCI74296.1 Hpt domain-containing protein [Exiguobacterium sp. SH1S1]TCI80589.1 Hpt domain-containing protein [Exiguobacterium sp. SH0S1]